MVVDPRRLEKLRTLVAFSPAERRVAAVVFLVVVVARWLPQPPVTQWPGEPASEVAQVEQLSKAERLAARDAPIDLNLASAEDLTLLPGVGPATAERILALRERKGGFESVEELLAVRGIGEARLRAMRPHLALSDPNAEGLQRSPVRADHQRE